MKARDLLNFGQEALKLSGIYEWDYDSRTLLEWSLNISRTDLILEPNLEVSEEKALQYKAYIERRASHEPLQYIMGECEFMGLPFTVNENVLIPRQDTEVLIEWILEKERIHWNQEMTLLDVCTGSGCIAISVDVLWKENGYKPLKTSALDISEKALKVAKKNSDRNKAAIQFYPSNMFEAISEEYDIIVSNPPYIPTKVVDGLMEEVVGHEPRIALDGMEDGLHFYRILAKEGKKHLKEGGRLYLEIGHDQGESVPKLLFEEGFSGIEVRKDLAGNDRCVVAIFQKS